MQCQKVFSNNLTGGSMFYNITSKSYTDFFIFEENYVGLISQKDIDIYPHIKNQLSDYTHILSNFYCSKMLIKDDIILCCISIPVFSGEKRKFCFVYNKKSIIFVDCSNFLKDILTEILNQHACYLKSSQDFIYHVLHFILKEDLEILNSISQNLSVLEVNILTDSSNYNYNANQILIFRGNSLKLHHYYVTLFDICRILSKNDAFISKHNQQLISDLTEYITLLSDESKQIWEYTSQIRDVYQQKLSVNQNNIMKLLTIVTTIFMPLTLLTGWYGMNFDHMKELHWKYSYPSLFCISILIIIILSIFFKKKNWW